jgi:DNA-binding transcriptional ArsR family regulator
MDTNLLTAIAEPNRLKIIELLREQPRSVNEVAMLLKLRQPQTSKHLHALSQAGLVTMHPVAQQRIYALNAEPFIQLQDWAGSFGRFWNQHLDNLDNYLKKGSL